MAQSRAKTAPELAPESAKGSAGKARTVAALSQTVPAVPGAARRVQVLLPLPLAGPYDYLDEGLDLAPGDIVAVPLGNRALPGVVWRLIEAGEEEKDALPRKRLKAVHQHYPVPGLPSEALRFIDWVASYCLSPPGAVLRMTLNVPAALEPPAPTTALRLREGAEIAALRMTPARARVIEQLAQGPALPPGDLARLASVGHGVVKGLVEAGVLERVVLPAERVFAPPSTQDGAVALSDVQREAALSLRRKVRAGGESRSFSVTLLDGVTGSGKTEVYFEAVAEAIEAGRQVLVLLPEIALSTQWLERFRRRFGVEPALWHSEVTPARRRATWRAVAMGEAQVVVGARSALFLPYRDLGLIIVDEEHDPSFKQEDGVIYHARDMAVVRARIGGFPAVLVSATPSLETMTNVAAGRYQRLVLPERHAGAAMPRVEAVDMRGEAPPRIEGHGQSFLSVTLREAMAEALAAGEQTILFLNRRGYAPLMLCRACGHRFQCPNCTAWLVEHRLLKRLECHHCGHAVPTPESCPECEAVGKLAACGPGVERLAQEVRALFPEARSAMMTSDTLAGPAAARDLIRAMQAREIDILIGTQIVAKGHHFPHLTVVGVVDADLGLTGGDLRAGERTFQLLHQVAGRAGRAEHEGRALLQTYDPASPVVEALVSGDRDAFLAVEAEQRRVAGMPPFTRLVALILSAPDAERAEEAARALARTAPRQEGIEILGPAPAPLAILRGRHRVRLLLKTRRDVAPQGLLRNWLDDVDLPGGVRLAVDVDPYSFL